MIRILFTGGGTGGHIYPLIAVAQALRKSAEKRGVEIEFHYLGALGKYRETLTNAGMYVREIVAGKLHRHSALQSFFDAPKFFILLSMVSSFLKLFLHIIQILSISLILLLFYPVQNVILLIPLHLP